MSFRLRSSGRSGSSGDLSGQATPSTAAGGGPQLERSRSQLERSRSLLELLNASVKRVEPSGRVPISRYLGIGNQLLEKADAYRKEGNVEQLYVMLMRFASLMIETLPKHPENDRKDKQYLQLRRKLVDIYLPELETIQEMVRRRDPNPEYADSASELLTQYKLEAMRDEEELQSNDSGDFDVPPTKPVSNGFGSEDMQRQNSASVGS